MLRKFLNKLLALFERAMIQSAILEEADFRLRYFQHWAKCQASDIYDTTLDLEQDIANQCKDILHYLDMRKK
jgi:hypothetical protein